MNKEEIIEVKDALESIQKDMCNIYSRYPSDKQIQKATIDVGYLKEYLDKKIEAPSVQTNASK